MVYLETPIKWSSWWMCFVPNKKRLEMNERVHVNSTSQKDHQQNCQNRWLVVSTHLKNISQIGSFPQVGLKIKNLWNHHLGDDLQALSFISLGTMAAGRLQVHRTWQTHQLPSRTAQSRRPAGHGPASEWCSYHQHDSWLSCFRFRVCICIRENKYTHKMIESVVDISQQNRDYSNTNYGSWITPNKIPNAQTPTGILDAQKPQVPARPRRFPTRASGQMLEKLKCTPTLRGLTYPTKREVRKIIFKMPFLLGYVSSLEGSHLVGGWNNPSEKYARQIGFIFPHFRGEHKKYSKPPPSHCLRNS